MVNKNYWKLQGTIRKLRKKENKCFICGSTEDIVPHHINQVKQDNAEYYSENNVVLLCDYHHHQYHRKHQNVNQKTFCEFLRDNLFKNKPKNSKRGKKMIFTLDKELKISKLKRILKLVTKTQMKVVKISINGQLYDISNVINKEDVTIFELGDFTR